MTHAAVVFDFDGVLADTEGLHLAAFQDTFATHGWTLERDAYFSRYLGFDDRDLVEHFLDDQGVSLGAAAREALIIDKGRRYDARVASGRVLFPTATAAIARLGAEFPLAIASGSIRHEIISILRANDLDRAIPIVVGADDVKESKPAPDSYALAVERLGVAPASAVAIEDSHWGLVSARAAGLKTIGITTSYPASALGLAHHVVSSLDEVTTEVVRRMLAVR